MQPVTEDNITELAAERWSSAHDPRTAEVLSALVRHLHEFAPSGGVSGVAVLAESHLSIHTWPERGYAAVDVFMCGRAEPRRVIPILRYAFKAGRIAISEQLRGVV